jgi:hypothetical protein
MKFLPVVLAALVAATGSSSFGQAVAAGRTPSKPFSAVGVAVKVGVEGIGFDVATPLARKFNVRAGASFFSYNSSLTEDGITINPDIKFRKAGASLDYYPFGGSFRISPGFVFYNGNHAAATALVPAGMTFDLNDTTYTSSATDPVHGTAEVLFGKKQAPSFTIGWGNIVPRRGGHFSVPVEIGFEYIGKPTLTYNLMGTACSSQGCGTFTDDPEIQADLKAEQNELNNDIAPLRFYPIVSIGLGYKF